MKRSTSYGLVFALALGLGLALGLVWLLGIPPGIALATKQLDVFWEEDFSAPISSTTYYTTATAGSGVVSNTSFLLTQNASGQRGRIFYLTPTPMDEFTATFRLYLGDHNGADGAAFIFCPVYDYSPSGGGSLDATCPDGYLVAFDTYGAASDQVYVAHDSTAAGNRLVTVNVPELEDGAWHTAGVDFRSGTITVTLDGSNVIAGATLPDYVPFWGYFGFSGSTGGSTNEQRVDDIVIHASTGNVFLSPSSTSSFIPPGATTLYTETLHNFTGADDSFDLALSGNVWPAALSMTDTGVISNGASITFTVQVTVSISADPGDSDTVTLKATSATSPTVYSDTATLTTMATCTDPLIFSGRSEQTEDDLDDVWEYGGQRFSYADVDIWSGDNDSMNATLSGYDPGSGWTVIASLSGSGNAILYDDQLSLYTQLRVQLDDTDDNDWIYYNYEFHVCRSEAVNMDPNQQQSYAAVGTTQVYTHTLVNYAMRDAQFDLATSGHTWPSTVHNTGGALINQTPVLSDLETYTLTVWVDVPPGATLGSTDALTLTASEVISPSIRDSVFLTTTAVSDQKGYIFNEDADQIHIVDTVIHLEIGSIAVSSYGDRPFRGAISPNGSWLYVGLFNSDRVLVVNTDNDTPVGTIPVGDRPHGIAFDASGDYAVVVNSGDDSVSIIATASRTVSATLPVGRDPRSVAVDPTLGLAYVTNREQSTISVIDVGMQTMIDTISGLNYPWDVVISPVGYRAYVSNQGAADHPATGSIGVIDTSAGLLIDTWTIPNSRWISSMDISSDGTRLYVVDSRAGSTYVIDTANGQVVATIPTSSDERNWDIEVFPDGAGSLAYVTDVDDNNVKVVDTDANTVMMTITLSAAGDPRSVALFPPDTASRPPILALLPAEAARGEQPGNTLAFTQWLYNRTGAAHSFDLALSDDAWPAALSSANTGPLPAGASISFTVWVTVPVGAAVGDSDLFTVTATSQSDPGLYDTAQLKAVATQFGYAFLVYEDEIAILDLVLHTAAGVIDTSPYGGEPIRGAISPDGTLLYTSLRDSGLVLVVDTATNTPVMSITVGSGPHGVAFSNDGAYAFVANQWDGTVSVIDAASQTVTATLPVGSDPRNVAASPCLNKLYVTNNDDNTVSVVDIGTMTVTQVITGFAAPKDVVVSPYGHRAYVTNQDDGTIGVIDTSDDTLIATWDVGGSWFNGLDISPDGRRLYAADNSNDETYVIDATNGQLLTTLPSGDKTWDVEVFPDWAGAVAYVSVADESSIKVIDTDTDTIVGNISLSSGPRGLALFPQETTCSQGILLSPHTEIKHGQPGNTLAFTQRLYNQTGAADSFDLTLSGNVWTTTLSTANTGVFSAGALISFTVWVEVPAGAEVDDQDLVTVTATSVANSSLYSDTSELTSGYFQLGYAFLTYENKIAILGLDQHTVLGTIDTTPYGDEPIRGALSPDGDWLYASLRDSGLVLVVDTATNTPVMSITVGGRPHGVAFSSDGVYAFVANQWDGTVSVIDTASQAVTTTLPVGSDPRNVAASPCLNKLYVTNRGDDTVSVVDIGTMTVTQVITGFAEPKDVVVSPYGRRAYVTNQNDGTIGVIDTLSDTLIATWDVGGSWFNGLDISPDGRRLYAADNSNDETYVIDATNGQLLTILRTGDATWDAEVFPDWAGAVAYVSVADESSIKVIDTDTDTIIGNIPLSGSPRGLALFSPSTLCDTSPTAAFTPTLSAINVGDTVTFTNLSTGTLPLTFIWDFGDGSPLSSAEHPTHTYNVAGAFTVALTATNLHGEDVATGAVEVYVPPTAAFTPTLSIITVGDTVTFTNLSTGSPPLSYQWDFGDSSPVSSAEHPPHTYSLTGTFTVLLTATNPYGQDVATGTVKATPSSVPTYTLEINVVGSGSVTKVPSATTYLSGTLVQLTAVPGTGWQFVGWSGDVISTTTPVSLTMDADKIVTATFSQEQYTLTVNIVNSGTVTIDPDQATYLYGDVVTLTATPNFGWHFGGWSGDLIGADNPATLVMNSDKVVTATFTTEPPATYTLTVHTVGSGSVEPGGGTYISGTMLSLTATPDPGWQFDSWSGALSDTTTPVSLTMDADKVVTATFTEISTVPTYTLTTTVSPTVGGSVTLNPSGGVYAENTVVTVTAIPAIGYEFVRWSGDLMGTVIPATIAMTRNMTVTANFNQTGFVIYLPLVLRNH